MSTFTDAWTELQNMGNILGGVIGTLKDATAAAAALGIAIQSLNKDSANLVRGFENILGTNEYVINTFMKVAEKSLYLEKRNQVLAKTFGVTSKASLTLGSVLQKNAFQYRATGEQLMVYAKGIRDIIPTINQFSDAVQGSDTYKGLVRVQQVLTTNLGLTAEQAEKYSGFAGEFGGNILDQLQTQKNLSDTLETSYGVQGAFKIITEEIAGLTEDVQVQYGQIPGNLQLAVVKAKQLGLNMTTLYNTGKKLLNIEESIGAELEYQLLSGRRLVDNQGQSLTNRYREATMMGDANAQANVLNTILEKEGKTLRKNLFAREQMSQLLGMDEAALSRALQKKSILESLPGGDSLFEQTGDALINAAKALGASNDDLQQLVQSEDTRTTDDILKQILWVQMENSGITKEMLENQFKYGTAAARDVVSATMGPNGLQKTIQNPNVAEADDVKARGFAKLEQQFATAVISDIKTVILKGIDKTVINTDGTTGTSVNDAIVMPDGETILNPSPADAMVFFKPGGPIEQGLSNGMSSAANAPTSTSTPTNGSALNNNATTILQAIYNELVRQTDAVKSSNRTPTWSTDNLAGIKLYG